MAVDMSQEIAAACKLQHDKTGGVFPPQVCPYCFGCPIATIVAGVSGNNNQRGAIPIPDDNVPKIKTWLAKYN